MRASETVIIEGRGHSWRVILELHRVQLEAWRALTPTVW